MTGLISTHRSSAHLTVEDSNTVLSISLGEKFKLREYLGTYFIIDKDEDTLQISKTDFDMLTANHVELVVVDAPSIHKYLQEQTNKSIKPRLLANIASGNTNDAKTRKATHVILKFLGEDLYDASCENGLLIIMLSYLAGNYCGRTDGPACAELIAMYGNPTKEAPKPARTARKLDTEVYTQVDGFMRLKDGTEVDLNVVPIEEFYATYDPNNPVETLKDVGIRAEDAVIRLINKDKHRELTTPLQVNKYLKKICG